MLIYFLLITLPLVAGVAPMYITEINSRFFYLGLVFSGAFLFSITIVHLMPEIFQGPFSPGWIGIIVLAGYYMQLLLDFFTTGIEHGHLHRADAGHSHHRSSVVSLLIALCLHAFLEGSLLSQPQGAHHHGEIDGLLLGILLHKMPAAFALMSFLLCTYEKRAISLALLLVFSLATPLGLGLSDWLLSHEIITPTVQQIIFALVCGNFLHISTTIFFESSPAHAFNLPKLVVAVAGALLAVSVELFV